VASVDGGSGASLTASRPLPVEMAMTEAEFNDLLDETLFAYADNTEPVELLSFDLDATVRRIARRERYHPSKEDVTAIAALAYEQLAARDA